MTYRDSHGKRLTDYPRPSVAVDTALLTLSGEGLTVLQVRQSGERGYRLPGTFLHEGERLMDAVLRSLRVKAGVEGLEPQQLHVFDDPRRDDRGWVLSVAHVMLVPEARLASRLPDTRLRPVASPGQLPYGHGRIVDLAVRDVRERYAERPDPAGLLPDAFTVLDLRRIHTVIAGVEPNKDTFRRQMDPHLIGTGEMTTGTRGRPAELFSRRGDGRRPRG